MSKTKYYILGCVFLCCVLGVSINSIKIAEAQTTATTFPVDDAGIAAYVKLDNIEDIDIDALAEAFHTVERQDESYVIGTVKVDNLIGANYPHVYVGMDGWIVAYYLNAEEASRIMQWKGYTPGTINTTTLKDAVDIICNKTGVSYSTPIKYYDFEFPEANKMTVIAEAHTGTNDFYVTVPGTLYEASYQVSLMESCGGGSAFHTLRLKVDETVVFEASGGGGWCYWLPFSSYGYYDLSTFQTGITHYVTFGNGCAGWRKAYSTVLIYKN